MSAVYNIFSFAVFIPVIFVLPRMVDPLHPGSGDNPTFRLFDTAHTMKLVIYTAITSFIGLGYWLLNVFLKLRSLKKLHDENFLDPSSICPATFLNSFCQATDEVEMADVLRRDGKIYTVVIAVVIILTATIILLLRVDRKIFRLEKKFREEDKRM